MLDEFEIMDAVEMAKALRRTKKGLYAVVRAGNLSACPPPMRLGGRLCWRKIDFRAWLERQANRHGAAIMDQQDHSSPEELSAVRRRGRPRKSTTK